MTKLLSHKETRKLIQEMTKAAQGGPRTFDPWYDLNQRPVTLYFANGELMRPEIRGYLWAWNLQGKIGQSPVTERLARGMNIHGLEGLARVETELTTALCVYRDLPEYRARIEV